MPGQNRTPLILCVVEGLGENPHPGPSPRMPGLDRLRSESRLVRLTAPAPEAGPVLPLHSGDMFEVLGTGRPLQSSRPGLDALFRGRALATSGVLENLVRTAVYEESSWHLFAGLSDSHTALEHLGAMLDLAETNSIPVVLHAVAGMDPGSRVAQERLAHLDRLVEGRGTIGTLSGSEFACDREGRWDRTYRAYHAVVRNQATGPEAPVAESAYEALRAAYADGLKDAEIPPVRLGEYRGVRGDFVCDFGSGNPVWEWRGEDIGFDAGHRPDAFGQLMAMFTTVGVPESVVATHLTDLNKRVFAFEADRLYSLVGGAAADGPHVFTPEFPAGSLAEAAAGAGMALFRCGELSRREWMTTRFDGGAEEDREGEERAFLTPVRHPDSERRNPDMCTYQLADRAVQAVRSGRFDLVVVGFPELALTGVDKRERVWAMEAVDQALGDLGRVAADVGANLVLAATLHPAAGGSEVPEGQGTGWCLIRTAEAASLRTPDGGGWIDVAPTLLALLGLEPPSSMAGRPLIG